MLRRICITLAALAAVGGGALVETAPAQAQGYSYGPGPGYGAPGLVVPDYGNRGYGPPAYARPHGYYRPAAPPRPYYGGPRYGYGGPGAYGPRPVRCWNRPVQVWDGWGYSTQFQRVCR